MKKIIASVIISTLTFGSCKKTESPTTTTNTNTTTGTLTSKFYFQATIDGTVVTFQDGIGGYGCGAGESGGSTSSSYQEIQSTSLTIPLQGKNQAGFALLKTFSSAPIGAEIEPMFSVKAYTYGKDDDNGGVAVDGAQIFYLDGSGVYWSTDLGIADQTGSTFNITEHIDNTDGYSHKISKATFSCKLYDANGHSKTLTNGVCRGRTVLY